MSDVERYIDPALVADVAPEDAPTARRAKRGRPPATTRKVRQPKMRDWRGENRYMEWLESPPPRHQKESEMARKVLAQLRAAAVENGFSFRAGAGWAELSKELGLQRLQVAQMMRGRQRMPLHYLCIIAAGLGLKLTLVRDDDDGLATAVGNGE